MEPHRDPTELPPVLVPLQAVDLPGSGRASKAAAQLGSKAVTLGRLIRDDLPVPRSWILSADSFVDFTRDALPRGHDLRTLLKLSGSAEGHERCARAYRRMLDEPLPGRLQEAIDELWRQHGAQLPWGLTVRASVVMPGGRAALEPGAPRAIHGVSGTAAVGGAVQRTWAALLLSSAIAEYAAAGHRDVSVAVLLQETVEAAMRLQLTEEPASGEDGEQAPEGSLWMVAARADADTEAPWKHLPPVVYPLSLASEIAVGNGAAAPTGDSPSPSDLPSALLELARRLGGAGMEELRQLADSIRDRLDAPALLEIAVSAGEAGSPGFRLLSVRPQPTEERRRHSRRGHFSELGWGARAREPASHLGASVIEQWVRRGAVAALQDLRCGVDEDALTQRTTSDRSYFDVATLAEAAAAVPFGSVESLLLAVGGQGHDEIIALARTLTSAHRARWKIPAIGAAALLNQIRIEHETEQALRTLDQSTRAIAELDLTLLPNDGITTTLATVQETVEQASSLWARWLGAQLMLQVIIAAVVRRRVPEAPVSLGMVLTAGAGRNHGATMGLALQPAIDALKADAAAFERVRAGVIRSVRQLPDGRFRGALGHFLASYGDLALGVFDVARPRWSEDASDLLALVKTLAGSCAAPEDPIARARASAATELARYEPFLPPWERRLLLAALDRCKTMMQRRREVDRRVLRSLQLLRTVLRDVDRRLRRIEPAIMDGGVFYCQPGRLIRALTGGRPELGELIEMRQADRKSHSARPVPPTTCRWLPPTAAPLTQPGDSLEGIGASSGVVQGRIRHLDPSRPPRLRGDEVLVTPHAEIAMSPLYLRAAALVAETGGTLSPAAETAREYGVPAVLSVRHAVALLREGEPVRVDGTRGHIDRLDGRGTLLRDQNASGTP